MIIIITENQILKVDRIVIVEVDKEESNILAKLERETVPLGTYRTPQAKRIMSELRSAVVSIGGVYEMPERQK